MNRQTDDLIGQHDFIFKTPTDNLFRIVREVIWRLEDFSYTGSELCKRLPERVELIRALEIIRGLALLHEIPHRRETVKEVERSARRRLDIHYQGDYTEAFFGRNLVTVTEVNGTTTLSLWIADDREPLVPAMLLASHEVKLYIERTWPSLEKGDIFYNKVRYVRADLYRCTRSARPVVRGEISMRDIIDVHGEYSYKFDLSVDGLIAACDEQIKHLFARRFRDNEHEMLKAMEHLKCVPVLFKEPDNDAVRLLNGKIINRCEVTKQRYDDTDHTCVIVETHFDSVTLVDYGDSIELLFYIDTQSADQCIPRIWKAATALKENCQDNQSTKPKAKVKPTTKPTTKGETQMAIIPTQPTKPITLSKPSKASDYDLPLRDDLQWLAQNVSKINHHFELASFGQTLHLGKSTDDTPPSFSAKLVVRPTTIVTESTYEVTLIWEDVEYVDGVFRTSRYPEFHSKEVTDFYQLAQQVKHGCAPAISELFYSAAIHLDYQRGGYLVNQDDVSGSKKS